MWRLDHSQVIWNWLKNPPQLHNINSASINKILFWILAKHSTRESHQVWTKKAKYCNCCSLNKRWAVTILIFHFLTHRSWNSCNVCPVVSKSKKKGDAQVTYFPQLVPTPAPRSDTLWKNPQSKILPRKSGHSKQGLNSASMSIYQSPHNSLSSNITASFN